MFSVVLMEGESEWKKASGIKVCLWEQLTLNEPCLNSETAVQGEGVLVPGVLHGLEVFKKKCTHKTER